jgi:acyl-CoA synthetase (NDP forming)
VLANLKAAGFAGRVIPVNPGVTTVQGLPAVPAVSALEDAVDLAVIAVPPAHVLPTLKECVVKGVRGAVVISAGFREIGGEGEAREAELRAWLRDQPIRVLGPNCLGWIRPGHRLNVTLAPGMPRPGHVAFISHSGALAVAILDWSRERPMRFSLFASPCTARCPAGSRCRPGVPRGRAAANLRARHEHRRRFTVLSAMPAVAPRRDRDHAVPSLFAGGGGPGDRG